MSNDPYSIGMLHALACSGLDLETTEKVASRGAQAAGLLDKGIDFVKSMNPRQIYRDTSKAVEHRNAAQIAQNNAEGFVLTPQARRHASTAASTRTALADKHKAEAMTGAKRLGGTALGTTGLAYGMGDADTMENRAANMSNRMVGTNFSTKSRFGNLIS